MRDIKELLEIVRAALIVDCIFIGGLRRFITHLKWSGAINQKEVLLLKEYLDKNLPTLNHYWDNIGRSQFGCWKPGVKKFRIKWLDKEIAKH